MHCTACGQPTRPHDGRHRRCPGCGHIDYRNPAPAVSGICIRDGKVLLSKRAHPPHPGAWDLPGGFVEAGESGQEALRREIHEETGMRVTAAEVLDVRPGDYAGRPTLTIVYRFEAAGEPQAADDSEALRWWPLADRPSLCWEHEEQVLGRQTEKGALRQRSP